jgi:hypothetical protein
VIVDVIRWDEKAGLQRDPIRSQAIEALEAQEIKETDNEEDLAPQRLHQHQSHRNEQPSPQDYFGAFWKAARTRHRHP